MNKSNQFLLVGSLRHAPRHKCLGSTPRNKTIKFQLRLSEGHNHLPALAAAVAAGTVQPLSAEQIAATVNYVCPKVLSRVKKALSRAGFKVGEFDRFSCLLPVEGTAHQVRRNFGATLDEYRNANGAVYTGRQGNLSLPASWGINSYIVGIHGIDERPKAQPRLVRAKGMPTTSHATRSWNPKAAADHYGVPQDKLGSGFACGFVSLGGGIDPDVVNKANARLGLPPCNVTVITVDGATNSPSGSLDGADGENYLDVQCQAAIAPQAKIIMSIGPNTTAGFANALLALAKHSLKPKKISISWGASEDTAWTADDRALMDKALQTCMAMGIVVYCAAGDNGSSDGADDSSRNGGSNGSGKSGKATGGAGSGTSGQASNASPNASRSHCDYPASSPWNVACSGVFDDGSSVKAWNGGFFGGATGGGVSSIYKNYTAGQLLLQKAGVNLPVNADSKKPGRIVGDIAGIADPQTGIEVMAPDGSVEVIGGTSAVAPFHAAAGVCVDSELGQAMPDLNTVIYKLAASGQNVCVPVTAGNNGAYSCQPGDVINAVCGLGTLDYKKLLAALRG